MNELAVEPINEAVQCRAQSRRAPRDRLEHRLHIRWGAADDAKHLARCGLVFESLCQFLRSLGKFTGARLDLLEQPCVLDGDDGLVRKGIDKLDLLFGE